MFLIHNPSENNCGNNVDHLCVIFFSWCPSVSSDMWSGLGSASRRCLPPCQRLKPRRETCQETCHGKNSELDQGAAGRLATWNDSWEKNLAQIPLNISDPAAKWALSQKKLAENLLLVTKEGTHIHTHARTHTHTALVSFFHRLFLNICIMFIISFMLMSWRTTPDRNRVISRNQLLLFYLFGHLVQFITTASDFGSVCFVLFAFCLVRAELWHFYSTTQTEGRGIKWH